MRGLGVDARLAPVEDRPHLFAPRGGYTNWPTVGNVSPAGRLLVFDGGKCIYGYGRMAYRAGGGHVRPDMAKDYHLFAEVLDTRPAAKSRRDGKRRIAWTAQPPFVVRAMVLTRDALLLAGGTFGAECAEGQGPGAFQVASREDGSPWVSCALSAAPVLDGMAFTDAGVFVSTLDGTVVCLRPASQAKESPR